MRVKETIEVIHDTEGGRDVKEIRFNYNNFHVNIEIGGEAMGNIPVSIFVKNLENDDSLLIDIEKQKELKLSINYGEGMGSTEMRSYKEWKKLEQLENALKIVGKVLK